MAQKGGLFERDPCLGEEVGHTPKNDNPGGDLDDGDGEGGRHKSNNDMEDLELAHTHTRGISTQQRNLGGER